MKYNLDGTLDKYKARLVAKGYSHAKGIDYEETFTPISKMATLRTIIAVGASHSWHFHQIDAQNVFLHDTLDEEVYMKVPQGYKINTNETNIVCKLHKSLYRLKQASRAWFSKLKDVINNLGFQQCKSDHSMFISKNGSSTTIILAYVDDLLITRNILDQILSTKQQLKDHFSIKDMGAVKYFIGLEFSYNNNNDIFISQCKYALDLLSFSKFSNCKPISTPSVKN